MEDIHPHEVVSFERCEISTISTQQNSNIRKSTFIIEFSSVNFTFKMPKGKISVNITP